MWVLTPTENWPRGEWSQQSVRFDHVRRSSSVIHLYAREAEVEVEVHIGPGLMHVWPILPIPEARTSRAAINEFLQAGR